MDAQPDPAEDARLAAWRAELDRLNGEIVERLQARARIVRAIGRFKRERGVPAFDPQREREMLAELLREPGEGFRRDELARLLRIAMRFYRRLAEVPPED